MFRSTNGSGWASLGLRVYLDPEEPPSFRVPSHDFLIEVLKYVGFLGSR